MAAEQNQNQQHTNFTELGAAVGAAVKKFHDDDVNAIRNSIADLAEDITTKADANHNHDDKYAAKVAGGYATPSDIEQATQGLVSASQLAALQTQVDGIKECTCTGEGGGGLTPEDEARIKALEEATKLAPGQSVGYGAGTLQGYIDDETGRVAELLLNTLYNDKWELEHKLAPKSTDADGYANAHHSHDEYAAKEDLTALDNRVTTAEETLGNTYSKTECDAAFLKKSETPEGADLSSYLKAEDAEAQYAQKGDYVSKSEFSLIVPEGGGVYATQGQVEDLDTLVADATRKAEIALEGLSSTLRADTFEGWQVSSCEAHRIMLMDCSPEPSKCAAPKDWVTAQIGEALSKWQPAEPAPAIDPDDYVSWDDVNATGVDTHGKEYGLVKKSEMPVGSFNSSTGRYELVSTNTFNSRLTTLDTQTSGIYGELQATERIMYLLEDEARTASCNAENAITVANEANTIARDAQLIAMTHDRKIIDLQTDIATLTAANTALEAKNTALEAEIDALKAKLNNHNIGSGGGIKVDNVTIPDANNPDKQYSVTIKNGQLVIVEIEDNTTNQGIEE